VYRRAVLAAVPLLAGCSAFSGGDEGTTTETAPTTTRSPTPTLPLTASDPASTLETARGIDVRNGRSETAFTTVVVEDGDRTVYAASGTVGRDETWRHENLVARPGVYRVIVETGTGERAVHGWVVGEQWGRRNLVARLVTGGVTTRQYGICSPDCPPMRAEGESVPLPSESRTDPGREVAGAVTLENARGQTAPVSLRVATDDRTLVDYRYWVPPGVRAIVPVVRTDGVYDLAVSGPDRRLERRWYVPEEPFPQFRVGVDGVASDCEFGQTRITGVRNSGGSTRTVGVAVQSGDRTGESETVSLSPDESRSLGLAVAPGPTTLSVFVDGTERLTAGWTVCPGGPLRVIVVDGTVFVRNDDRVVASAFADG
jgi:hypothetical protein